MSDQMELGLQLLSAYVIGLFLGYWWGRRWEHPYLNDPPKVTMTDDDHCTECGARK